MKSRPKKCSRFRITKPRTSPVTLAHNALMRVDGLAEESRPVLVARRCDPVDGDDGGFIVVSSRTGEGMVGHLNNTAR